MGNSPFWLLVFIVVPFDKIPLISKDVITINFILYFISLFVRVILVPENFYKSFIKFLEISTVSIISLSEIFFDKSTALLPILDNTLIGLIGFIALNITNNLFDCTISRNWDFERFILVKEPFAKALQIFGTCVSYTLYRK